MTIRKTNSSIALYDLLFLLLLVLSFYFTRNILCSIMMVLFAGYTLLVQLSNRRKAALPFFCIGFAAFILYGALNIVAGNVINSGTARTMIISLTLNLIMIYAIIQYVVMRRDIVRVLQLTELSILLVSAIVMITSIGSLSSERLSSATVNANVLSMLAVYSMIICMYLKRINKLSTAAYWIRLALYGLTILLSGSRKGLIMVVVAIFVISMAHGRRRIIKSMLTAGAIAILSYLLIMNVEPLYNIIGVRVEALITLLTEGSTTDGSLRSRQTLISIGLTHIVKKPWTGYGYDTFKLISGISGSGHVSSGEVGYYSHNNYIELLFGGGIIGFVLYYLPIVVLLFNMIKALRRNPCMPYVLAILVSKLIIEYAYVSYYVRIDAYLMAVLAGCTFAFSHQRKPLSRRRFANRNLRSTP